MPRSESRSPIPHRKHREHPKSYALPDKKEAEKISENGRRHRRTDRKRRKSPTKHSVDNVVREESLIESGEMPDSDVLDELKDQDLNEIEKQVVEARRRGVLDPKAEEERLIRQKWAEEKRIKEELARRFEIYLEKQVQTLLTAREEEVQQIVAKRVAVERERIEKERKEAEEIRKDIERKERLRKMEEEMRQREELQRLAEERLKRIEDAKIREEEEKAKKLAEQLHQLEERQRREADDLKRKKKEQELVLNKNRSRAKLCFSFNK